MGKKILVVDDDSQIQILLKFFLEKEGFKVQTCGNGSEAINILQVHHFDLMLLDIVMPGMDGFETLAEVRNNPSTEKLHVIMISSNQSPNDVLQAAEYGVASYILKPPKRDELIKRVKHVLKKR